MDSYIISASDYIFKNAKTVGKKVAEKGKYTVYELENRLRGKSTVTYKNNQPYKILRVHDYRANEDLFFTEVYNKEKETLTRTRGTGDIFTRMVFDTKTDSLVGEFSVHKKRRGKWKIDFATFYTPKDGVNSGVIRKKRYNTWGMGCSASGAFQAHNDRIKECINYNR